MRWPLIWRRDYDALKTENFTLRSALKEANEEIRKHRALIAGLRTGQAEITRSVERVLATKGPAR